jgi:hypothetical protein
MWEGLPYQSPNTAFTTASGSIQKICLPCWHLWLRGPGWSPIPSCQVPLTHHHSRFHFSSSSREGEETGVLGFCGTLGLPVTPWPNGKGSCSQLVTDWPNPKKVMKGGRDRTSMTMGWGRGRQKKSLVIRSQVETQTTALWIDVRDEKQWSWGSTEPPGGVYFTGGWTSIQLTLCPCGTSLSHQVWVLQDPGGVSWTTLNAVSSVFVLPSRSLQHSGLADCCSCPRVQLRGPFPSRGCGTLVPQS